MNEAELRVIALQHATMNMGGATAAEVLFVAEKYLAFLLGAPDSPKPVAIAA